MDSFLGRTVLGILALFFIGAPVEGQDPSPGDTGEIRGEVVERGSGRPLSQVQVEVVDGPGPVTSDERGRFRLEEVPTGVVTLRAERLGYEPVERSDVSVTTGRPATVTLELRERALDLEEILVRPSRFQVSDDAPVSTTRLSSEEIRRTAGAQTDISRTLLSLPGVTGGADNRNELLVRGGGPGENAYWVDGIRVPRINHFETQGVGGGALGLLNVEFIEDSDFYAGAFPARYGDALSSTLVVRNRPGDDDGLRGDVTVGASEAGVTLDGPLGDQTTGLFSLRRSYLQLLFNVLDLPIRPTYWDGQYRVQWDPNDDNRLTFMGLGAINELEIRPPEDGDPERTETANRVLDNDQWSYTTGVVWRRLLESGSLRLSLSRSMESYRFEGRDLRNDETLVSNDSWEAENRIRLDGERRMGPRATLAAGVEGTYEGIESDFVDAGGVGRPTDTAIRFDDTTRWWKGSAYTQFTTPVTFGGHLGERLQVSLGLRADAHELLSGGVVVSPRSGLTLSLADDWELSAGAGRFLQAPPRLSLAVRDEGELVNQGLPFQESRHWAAGLEWSPSSWLLASVEGFYKPYRNMPRRADDPRVPLQSEGGDYGFVGAERLESDARGRAYGSEFFLRGQGEGRWYGLASYTLSWSEFRGPDGDYTPSAWDTRHAVDFTGGVRLRDSWEVGVRWRALSGRPFTPFDEEASQEAFERAGVGVPDLDRLNEGRAPPYHRLDLRVDRRFSLGGWTGRVYLDIQNLYNRTNVFGFRYTDDPDVPNNRRPREEIGILPTLGFTLEW